MQGIKCHYIGWPFGLDPPVIFPCGHTPTRQEIGIRFGAVQGPYTRERAEEMARRIKGGFIVDPCPLQKKAAV